MNGESHMHVEKFGYRRSYPSGHPSNQSGSKMPMSWRTQWLQPAHPGVTFILIVGPNSLPTGWGEGVEASYC